MTGIGAIVAAVAAGVGGALVYGDRRWRAATGAALARMDAGRVAPRVPVYDQRELTGLPAPVAHYFRSVLRNGQPIVTGVRLAHAGEFRVGESQKAWRPMTATEVFRTQPPGFLWDARIAMAPGVAVRVRDSYLDGVGSMRGEILGLVPMIAAEGTPEMASGAFQRYLAEAIWFPTALLPSQGVQWTAINDQAARATLADGSVSAALEFRFNAEGEITGAFSESRYREVKGTFQPTPWATRCWGYGERGGMRIPLEAQVEWQLPGGPLPYWRARITSVEFEPRASA